MPQAARGHRFRLAAGKQVAEGTPLTPPTFEYSVYDLSVVPSQDVRQHQVASDTDLPGDDYVSSASASGSVTVVSDPEGLGLFLMAHYGTDTPTGTVPNITHVFTRNEAKPWLTLYEMFPGVGGGSADRWMRISDAGAWGQTIAFNSGDPLKVTTDLLAKNARFHVSAPTAGTDVRGTADYLTYIGATMKIDIDATPAVTQVHNLISGSIRSEYAGTALEWTDEVTPYALDLGPYTAHFEAQAKLTNYELQSLEYFGAKTTADIDLTSVVTKGAISFTFPHGPVADANRTLKVDIPAMRFRATWPTLDVGGGPVIVTFSGNMKAPASGEAITTTLKSGTATY